MMSNKEAAKKVLMFDRIIFCQKIPFLVVPLTNLQKSCVNKSTCEEKKRYFFPFWSILRYFKFSIFFWFSCTFMFKASNKIITYTSDRPCTHIIGLIKFTIPPDQLLVRGLFFLADLFSKRNQPLYLLYYLGRHTKVFFIGRTTIRCVLPPQTLMVFIFFVHFFFDKKRVFLHSESGG